MSLCFNLIEITPENAPAADQTAPISALFVFHDALASLNPYALNSVQFGSVSALLNHKDMP